MSTLPPTPVENDPNPRPSNSTDLSVNGRSQPAANGVGQWNSGAPLGGPGLHLQPGFDIWGPLHRRKYLIALFCLIGAGLGYLNSVKTPKTYTSALRLMITTQARMALSTGFHVNFDSAAIAAW